MKPSWEKVIRRIAIGSDHAAHSLKEVIKRKLRDKGIEAVDVGTDSTESVDYPDFAEKVAQLVSKGSVSEGILVCGTGIGMSMVANKFPNVRAAVAANPFMAEASRSHNDANVLCIGARVVDENIALEVLEKFLSTEFEGGRHERRVNKIKRLDKGIVPPVPAEDSSGSGE